LEDKKLSLHGLVDLVSRSREFQAIREKTAKGEKQLILGLSGSQRSLLTAVVADPQAVTLFIGYNQQQAETIAQDLQNLLPNRTILVFNPNELLPHEEAVIDWELRKSRLDVLKQIREPGSIICVSIQALTEALIEPDYFYQHQLTIDLDTRVNLNQLPADLVRLGYERVDMVESYGQFSIRGGIIDIYPFTDEHPVRIELFDDEVDSIRTFRIDDQLSIEKVDQVTIFPARDRLYVDLDFEQVRDDIWQDAKRQSAKLLKIENEEAADKLLAKTAANLELLENKTYFSGIDQYRLTTSSVI
jgi:transcription-repair coupling factor (superfamily II helicase)